MFVAEGARFELAVHEVDAGFQDRCFRPLSHPSEMMVLADRREQDMLIEVKITIQRPAYKLGAVNIRTDV